MRVASDNRLLEVDPGATSTVVVDVVNTGEVIDGITANVIGLSGECVSTQPALLPLFPDTGGSLTVSLAVPPTHPAGRHPITVEVVSHGARLPSQYLDFDLDVSARPGMQLAAKPRLVRARRSGRFVLELTNTGNVPLDVTLQAVDAERSVTTTFSPPAVRLEPGTVFPVLLDVRGPRMFTGAEADRTVQVVANAARADLPPEPSAEPQEIPGERQTTVRLRQRPFISRGLLTTLILVGIVALWAAVFLLGLTKVFSNDPMTKAAPASFFAASHAGDANASPAAAAGGASGAAGAGTGATGAAGAAGGGSSAAGGGAPPADALPKSGQVPAGLGGQITGTVRATSDHQPVGRILVQAYRMSVDPQGNPKLKKVSAAATQTDGTYTIAGLFPTTYYLKFSAAGFDTIWFPSAQGQPDASPVRVTAQQTTAGEDAIVTGQPASISGKVDPGDTLQSPTTTVTARPLVTAGNKPGKPVVTRTKGDGSYLLAGLQAPGTYELTFTTKGYQPSTITETVNGGDNRLEPTVTLGAGAGVISGLVTDDKNVPIGGATVTTTVGGKPLTVATPTTGSVGRFTLTNLPTPATYIITFRAPGHGVGSRSLSLDAGGSKTNLVVKLAGNTGTITGRLFRGQGSTGLGGATVTVGGASVTGTGGTSTGVVPTTTTLTSGSVGTFVINGLPIPGNYTLTFTKKGYAPATVPVKLAANKAAKEIVVHLTKLLGSIEGVVTHNGQPVPGATITATNGQQSWTATSTIAGGGLGAGGYAIPSLQAGTYSVTATAPGLRQQTRIVTVVTGTATQHADLDLGS